MEFYAGIAAIVAPVFLLTLAGFFWTKRGLYFDQTMVTDLVAKFSVPCLVFTSLTQSTIALSTFFTFGTAAVACHALFAVVGMVVLKARYLPVRVYLPALIFPNTGNLGLPVCMFAFGHDGMALAVCFMTISFVGQFALGPAIAAGRFDFKGLIRLPVMHSLVLALLVKALGLDVPLWIENTTSLSGQLSVPIMLLSLGVALGELRVQNFGRVFWLSLLRVVGGAGIGWLVATAFGLSETFRGVLIIQSFMPAAVFNYLFARLSNTQPKQVASIILLSTVQSYVLLPALVAWVM
ncbi:MAG: AEC family transporter [Bradyrhizobium sp.]|nr:AEC family transporter [Bradyrhizobium sp.]